MAKSALSKSPTKKAQKLDRISPGVYRDARGNRVNNRGERIDSHGRRLQLNKNQNNKKKKEQPGNTTTPPPAADQQPKAFDQMSSAEQGAHLNTAAGQGVLQQLGYMQNQGAFNPGDFAAQQQAAYDRAMQNFERTTAPQFAREQADFQQMAAERGLDPNSEAYRALRSQMSDRQQFAREGAMLAGQEAANAIQQQGFNQAAMQYQMPAQMLGAYNPFIEQYGTQNQLGLQNQFQLQQMAQAQEYARNNMALENKFRLQQIAATPRGGGGGLSYEQQLGLIDRETANQAALLAMRQGQNGGGMSMGNAAAAGFGQGLAQGLMV